MPIVVPATTGTGRFRACGVAGGDMGRKAVEPVAHVSLTPSRAARLYKLLTLLEDGSQTRNALLKKLKLDVRGFYRDLEALRGFEIEITSTDANKYALTGNLDDALARLPFPDPGLNLRDALQLANGTTTAHRKLRQRINSFLNGSTKSANPNKPR
jgi:predicted DNA-binding transcriptional regulator YafY